MSTTSGPTTRNAERTRRAILDATARTLTEHGGGFTIALVADEAGVSKSGLLHHFPTREALLLAVAEDALQRFRNEIMRFVDLSENRPGKMLRAYVRALCGGSGAAMEFFTHSELWTAVGSVPGIAEVIRADTEYWSRALAEDGLHPDRVMLITYAAEGLAAAAHFDPGATGDQVERLRELLLTLSNENTGL